MSQSIKGSTHRSRPLRIERDDVPFFVSSRTVEARLLLFPLVADASHAQRDRSSRRCFAAYERRTEGKIRSLVRRANAQRKPYQPELSVGTAKRILAGMVGSALARAQARYGAEIYAVVQMSNHFHLVVRVPRKNLSAFIGYFKARMGQTLNLVYGRSGAIWARRFDAEPILDDEAALERQLYTLSNPVRQALVKDAAEWPGLVSALGYQGQSKSLFFEYLDRTAWHKAGRPAQLDFFFKQVTLTLSPLPEHSGFSARRLQSALSEQLTQRQQVALSEAAQERKYPRGLELLAQTDPLQRPKQSKQTHRPYCHASTAQERSRHRYACHLLYATYEQASLRLREGDRTVIFPDGMYPPALPLVA